MTTKQIQKIEDKANESIKYALKAIRKGEETHAALSLLEYKTGKVKGVTSVGALFRRLKV